MTRLGKRGLKGRPAGDRHLVLAVTWDFSGRVSCAEQGSKETCLQKAGGRASEVAHVCFWSCAVWVLSKKVCLAQSCGPTTRVDPSQDGNGKNTIKTKLL